MSRLSRVAAVPARSRATSSDCPRNYIEAERKARESREEIEALLRADIARDLLAREEQARADRAEIIRDYPEVARRLGYIR